VRCSLFAVRCSLFAVRCSLFAVRCSLFAVSICTLSIVVHDSKALLASGISAMAVNEVIPARAGEKLQVKAGQSDSSATFILGDEDHTLGNSLRHVLMQR
jgi:hypothetical protein